MKKLIVLEKEEETPKVFLENASRYIGIQCKLGHKYLVFFDINQGGAFVLSRGSVFISSALPADSKNFVTYYINKNFSVFCFDSQQEQFDWLTEV